MPRPEAVEAVARALYERIQGHQKSWDYAQPEEKRGTQSRLAC
jgi:hypothetical protein